ncbi:hypothetical protein HS125_17295 [bacterium]|nr:hypothetical protein [bacterium]
MANNAKYGFGERNAPANVESSTAVVRNCVSINDLFANTSTSTNFISVMRLPFTWVTVEDCIVIGSATHTAGRGRIMASACSRRSPRWYATATFRT